MKIISYHPLLWFFAILLLFVGAFTTAYGLATDIEPHYTDPESVGIVGGQDVPDPSPYPWQVSIGYRNVPNEDDRRLGHFCGGSVIAKRWILTAAHCMEYAPNLYENPEDLRVIVGRRTRSIADEGIEIDVLSYTIHRDYQGIENGNDVALILLEEAIPDYKTYVVTLMADNFEDELAAVGTMATITGWGGLKGYGVNSVPPRDQIFADVLQWVQVPIVSQTACNRAIGSGIRGTMLCAGFAAGGKDACQNDSGGPLVIQDGNGNYIQIGIVSFGLGCAAPNAYGVYTRVSAFRDWVEETTNLVLSISDIIIEPRPTSTPINTSTPTPTATPTAILIAPTDAPEPSDILTPFPTWTSTRTRSNTPSKPTVTKTPTASATPVWTPLPISTSTADEPRLNPDIDLLRDPIYDPADFFDTEGPQPATITGTVGMTDSVTGSSGLSLDLDIDIGDNTPTAGRLLSFEFDFENRSDRAFYGVILLVEIPDHSRFYLDASQITSERRAIQDIPELIWELPDGSGICPDRHPAHATCLLRLGTMVSGLKSELSFNVFVDMDAQLDTEITLDVLLKAADLTEKTLISVAASSSVQVVEPLSTIPTALDITDEPNIDYQLFLPFVGR